jgi:hypothetical protein
MVNGGRFFIDGGFVDPVPSSGSNTKQAWYTAEAMIYSPHKSGTSSGLPCGVSAGMER